MTNNIVKLVTLRKPYKLPNGMIFNTKNEVDAYIEGLKSALGNMDVSVGMAIHNASMASQEVSDD